MKRKDYTFQASDGKVLAMSKWIAPPLKPLKGVVQIVHGKAEHRKRYEDFAAYLLENGYAVFANDHRGHGDTISSPTEVGTFSCEEGWSRVVKDLIEIKSDITKEFPDLPLFLLGHSMGSFLVRTQIMEDPDGIAGVILSGTGFKPGFIGSFAGLIAKRESRRSGPDAPSDLMENLATGGYNKAFKPNRTSFDWLTRDDAVVDAFVKDPLCGFPGTPSFFTEILKGLTIISDQERVNLLPPELPIYLFSGDQDPVGNFTKDVRKTYHQYQKAGIKDLTVKFYPGCRHETLNEINRQEVYADVLAWLEAHL